MRRRPPRSKRTDTPLPDTTLFPSRAQQPVGAWFVGQYPAERLERERFVRFLHFEKPFRGRQLCHRADSPKRAADASGASGKSWARPYWWSRTMNSTFASFATCSTPMAIARRSEEHTSELQPLIRISYAVFCLKNKPNNHQISHYYNLL